MRTYPEMNKQIVEILRLRADRDPILLYAAQRIEELEQQLRGAQEAAQAQSEEIQRTWLSPAEAEGLRQQLQAERQAQIEAAESLAMAMARIGELEQQLGDAADVALAVAVGALEAMQ